VPADTVVPGESCDDAPSVDLSGATAGTTIDIWVDTSGREADLDTPLCDGLPDVVVRLDGLPENDLAVSADCVGELMMHVSSDDSPLCPSSPTSPGFYGGSGPCLPATMFSISHDPGTQYLQLCRDPADGPALVHITLQ
jgi:hypothetical protein